MKLTLTGINPTGSIKFTQMMRKVKYVDGSTVHVCLDNLILKPSNRVNEVLLVFGLNITINL